jgi:hypothetical protein
MGEAATTTTVVEIQEPMEITEEQPPLPIMISQESREPNKSSLLSHLNSYKRVLLGPKITWSWKVGRV